LFKTGAYKVVGKLFLASGLCGRASGQQATADLVKRLQNSSAWDGTLIIIMGFGLRIDQPPMLDLVRNLLPQDLRGRL